MHGTIMVNFTTRTLSIVIHATKAMNVLLLQPKSSTAVSASKPSTDPWLLNVIYRDTWSSMEDKNRLNDEMDG